MSFQEQKPRNGFIFGGNTGASYDDLKAMRAAAAQHRQNTSQGGYQGLASGIAAAMLKRRASKGEKAGKSAFTERFESMFGGGQSGAGFPAMGAPQASGGGNTTAPQGDMAGTIMAGLQQRGFPEHVAQAFVMNMEDESGLNPSVNEANPTVAGSRGGFGLYQLTGPRRRAYEAFAQERGAELGSVDAQLDFLVQELQGTESSAAQAILSTKDAGSAADAIVRKFLRPATEHQERRSQKYLGGQTPTRAPQGGGQGGGDMMQMMQLAGDPYASPAQSAMMQMMIQRQMQANDPMRQMQMERGQLELEQLRNPRVDPMQQVQLDQARLNLEQDRNPQAGYTMLSPEEISAMRLDHSKAYQRGKDGKISVIGGGGTNVTVNSGDNQPNVPDYNKLPAGYVYQRGPDGQIMINEQGVPTAAPIQGGPQDTTAQDKVAEINRNRSGDVVIEDIDRVLGKMNDGGLPVAGMGGSFWSNIPGTDAHDSKRLVETIRANVGFDRLQQMRDASKTGGALGAINKTEMDLLTNALGNLEQSQSAEQLQFNLERLKDIYTEIVDGPSGGTPISGPRADLSDDDFLKSLGLE